MNILPCITADGNHAKIYDSCCLMDQRVHVRRGLNVDHTTVNPNYVSQNKTSLVCVLYCGVKNHAV